MTQVTIHTDGACSGNPGPAGWAAILVSDKHQKEVVGGAAESTNNRAELMAVIVGLEALKFACKVTIYTDSQYVVGIFSLGWKRKANHDLLAKADALMAKHTVSFTKVEGHSGDAFNERCDRLAKAEVERQRSRAAFARQCHPEGECDNCFKPLTGQEAKRANNRSETLWLCDECAGQSRILFN
jgi:ribonuclease HI